MTVPFGSSETADPTFLLSRRGFESKCLAIGIPVPRLCGSCGTGPNLSLPLDASHGLADARTELPY